MHPYSFVRLRGGRFDDRGKCSIRMTSTMSGRRFSAKITGKIAMVDDIPSLRRILKTSRVIAVVGLSGSWFRPSYFAAKYMIEHGYTVIPVNPRYPEILGQKCYKSLRDIPAKVDIVDCFRKTADIMPIAEDAIAIGAKVLWQQLG